MLTCTENRELSWLRFNERVLEEAEDERVPLCERLSFLSIFQSNLDEFFMVRIGSLHDQMLLDKEARENKTNMTPGEQIDAAVNRIRTLCDRRDRSYADVLKKLEDEGISIVNFRQISPESEQYLAKIFREDYLPLLSTYVVGKKQTFPFLKNKEIYAVAVLRTGSEKEKIGIVPCGENMFPRLIEVPERTGCYILSEELILHYLPLLFGSYRIASKTLARITRSADIDADSVYDEDLNYRDHMAEVVRLRQKLCPVRLELRLGGFRRERVMLRLVKAQGANLHIIGEVVFVSGIHRHGLLGVGGCLFRLRIPLHEPCEALPALRTGNGIAKRRIAERNIKKTDALNNKRLAVLQIYRIAYGIRERFSLRDRSCFGNVCNCFPWLMPAVLLHILIRNMNEVAEIEVFQLVGNNLLQRAVLPGFQMLVIQIALQPVIHKVNVHLNGNLIVGDGGVSDANLGGVAEIRL